MRRWSWLLALVACSGCTALRDFDAWEIPGEALDLAMVLDAAPVSADMTPFGDGSDLPPPLKILNFDFGKDCTSSARKFGAAAYGTAGDYWNQVRNNKSALCDSIPKWADQTPLPGLDVDSLPLVGTVLSPNPADYSDEMMLDYGYSSSCENAFAIWIKGLPMGTYTAVVYSHICRSGTGCVATQFSVGGSFQVTGTIAASALAQGEHYVVFDKLSISSVSPTLYIHMKPGTGSTTDCNIQGLQLIRN